MVAPIICPKCGSNDQIRKASSLVAQGTTRITTQGNTAGKLVIKDDMGNTTGTGYGSATNQSTGVSQSALSQKLAPPQQPIARQPQVIALGVALIVFFGCGGLSAMSEEEMTLNAMVYIALGILLALFSPFVLRQDKEEASRHAQRLAQWQTAMERWGNLYYCQRDDGVFDPDENTFVPVDSMQAHIHR